MTDSNIVKSLLDNKEEEKTDSNIVNNLNQQSSDFTNVFKTESKFDDYVNNTLFDEETFDFASQDFDFTNNVFNDLTEDEVQKIKKMLGNTIAVNIKLRGEKWWKKNRIHWDVIEVHQMVQLI